MITPKDTLHKYKGFEIIGTFYEKEGSQIFYTGYYRPNSFHRNYNMKRGGKYISNPYCIIEKLSEAKDEIDEYIIKINNL
jgi:hypothetical protein